MASLRRNLIAKARRVDFLSEASDHECALLAAMGMSTHYIIQQTGLSPSQITYRIRRAGLTRDNGTSRLDFRNGVSPFTAPLLNMARSAIDKDLIRYLKANGT
jgi:hypothetical protein